MTKIFLVIVIGYVLGNFSSSYVFCKIFKNEDIRNYGSGNAGATNVLRVFGAKLGLLTFLFDALKGALAALIGIWLFGETGALLASVSVIVGHDWPVALNFKGGKGIATSIGLMAVINPIIVIIAVILGILIIYKWRYVSLASISVMALVPFIGLLIVRPFNVDFFIFTIIIAGFAIYRHKSNIKRLIDGNESKIGQRVS